MNCSAGVYVQLAHLLIYPACQVCGWMLRLAEFTQILFTMWSSHLGRYNEVPRPPLIDTWTLEAGQNTETVAKWSCK